MLGGRKLWTVVLALVLLAGAGAAVRHFLYTRLDSAAANVRVAVEQADSVRAANAAALTEAANLRLDLESARREVTKVVLDAARAKSALAAQRARTTIQIASAPDTCAPYIAALRADVDSAMAWGYRLESATDSLTRMDTKNTAQIARLTQSVVDAQGALARLGATSTTLVNRSKRPFLSRLLPKMGFGGTAGVSPVTGRPDAVIGLTLTWTP